MNIDMNAFQKMLRAEHNGDVPPDINAFHFLANLTYDAAALSKIHSEYYYDKEHGHPQLGVMQRETAMCVGNILADLGRILDLYALSFDEAVNSYMQGVQVVAHSQKEIIIIVDDEEMENRYLAEKPGKSVRMNMFGRDNFRAIKSMLQTFDRVVVAVPNLPLYTVEEAIKNFLGVKIQVLGLGKRLLLMRGPVASGKTEWAKKRSSLRCLERSAVVVEAYSVPYILSLFDAAFSAPDNFDIKEIIVDIDCDETVETHARTFFERLGILVEVIDITSTPGTSHCRQDIV